MTSLIMGATLVSWIAVRIENGATDCPTTEQLAPRIEAQLERPLDADDRRLDVAFTRDEEGYGARLRVAGHDGHRELRDPSSNCAALTEAVVVAAAVLLDEEHVSPRGERERQQAVPSVAPGTSGFGVFGHFGGVLALVGDVVWSAGGGIDVGLTRRLTLDVGVRGSLPSEHVLPPGRVSVRLFAGEVRLRYDLIDGMFRVGPTASLHAGTTRAQGRGYVQSDVVWSPWFAAGVGAAGGLTVFQHWHLGLAAQALLPSRVQEYSVGYVGTAYRSPVVGGLLEMTLGVKLP